MSYYSDAEESEYYDEEEEADNVVIPPKDKKGGKKPAAQFDPRKDKILDISADDSQFEKSLKYFEPPVEHHNDTLVSDHERIKYKGGTRPD